MFMAKKVLTVGLMLLVLTASRASAQQAPAASPTTPGAMTVEERTLIAQGWALLAQGLLNDAQVKAAKALEASPKNPSALVLAVEVAVTRGGSQAGLAQYEQWVAQRMEEPIVVRRIAAALLKEGATQTSDGAARLEALRALAGDGDSWASAQLSAAANGENGAPERRMLASIGDERAVTALIADLKNGTANMVATIETLGRSGSKLAVQPLVDVLQNQSPELRGAAAEGLGRLGTTLGSYDLIPKLKPLLQDRTSFVRVRAAGALYGLNDQTGLPILQELLQAEQSTSRLIALQAMSSRPDAVWLEQLQRLATAPEPEVRVGVARLLAPHDPQGSRRILEGVMNDPNPALREMASDVMGAVEATDLPTLRRLMKSNDRLTGVRAAARVLTVLR